MSDPSDTTDDDSPSPPRSGVQQRQRLVSFLERSPIVFATWVVAVTLLVVPFVYRAEAKLGPGTFSVSISPTLRGNTTLAVPPIGSLSARTHDAPVRLDFELREVDFLDAIDPDNEPGIEGIEAEVRDDLPGALTHLVLVLALTSVAIGLGAAVLFPGDRSIKRTAVAAMVAPVLVAALVAPAARGYDVEQFERSPELKGPLGSAEMLFAKVGSLNTRFGTVSSRTEVLAAKITDLYSAATTDKISRSDGEVSILHVSDLHLNSVGLSLAKDLADRFEVDAVIDTGDITSFGFEPEAGFVRILEDFSMPYYVIAGNHDSHSVRRQLRRSDAVTYIDGRTVDVGDVKILGISDPTVTALRKIPQNRIDTTYRNQFESTERLVERTDPDLVMVHNPVQLRPILGKVPAAAAGHLHETKLEVIEGTVVAIVGSSGATGLGDLLVEEDEPYRFEILRFLDRRLVAVDEISLNGASGDFTLRRRLLDTDEQDTTDELPDPVVDEPSLEEMEEENPEALEAVTSTTRARSADGPTTMSTTTVAATSSSVDAPVPTDGP